MSSSMMTLSRRLYCSLLRTPNAYRHFSTDHLFDSDEADSAPDPPAPDAVQEEEKFVIDRPLENGLDVGIYRAILVGKAGQAPLQKKLKSGTSVTLLSVGTGGIHNNRRPRVDENPKDYANRSAIQWHRVSVYPQKLGDLVTKHVVPGSMLYVEGNLETKCFTDPITGIARRIREIAVRRNGRIVFLGEGGDAELQTLPKDLRAVGYY
ncbi:hypothetical protein AAZX31_05G013800 [Glycine max]|uniref:Single-stranded DNA-binding protein n=2 Tax=Glycine subgen. Soja TaxID=1462606 RepID=I1K195_SOYBN|nr:single-stranded DNA-binding protein, mitochondrial [Glycine max]XP_028231224.1 single-stranded DNA-binding protein, mitochondrial [Glycine soja]KAG5027866.1 hypothetical protein JHK87_011380 [Glycine soja]KAG5153529.1 hypothetical protein JHK82_011498 [Glycine max]KAH1132293.1 hypothetical protein GYH30_011252 [Glycine max]KHN15158.1 Single-stranded DNA-binding protein, mitochondrial [Glycine soja]KRH56704.1 hypothetical protein GLYMA_05G014200v4 [Glycine max]|eukprot:XP_003524509.1 single-stranded DNA-binding protein, mitochondrial [Glycine max]